MRKVAQFVIAIAILGCVLAMFASPVTSSPVSDLRGKRAAQLRLDSIQFASLSTLAIGLTWKFVSAFLPEGSLILCLSEIAPPTQLLC